MLERMHDPPLSGQNDEGCIEHVPNPSGIDDQIN